MRFKRTLSGLAAGACLLLGGTAAIADGPRGEGLKDARSYERPFAWTGFYVGAAIGYGIGAAKETQHRTFDNDTSDILRDDTAIRGAQRIVSAGYDSQISQRVVVGMLIDYSFGSLDGIVDQRLVSIDKQFAIGARLGYLVAPKTLLFATAGWTRAEYENEFLDLSISRNGYFVGAGLEQALTNNWSLKLEYRYSDYGHLTQVREIFFPILDLGGTGKHSIDTDVHSVRLGVNYKFGR
jgi:outer membrane immunogenic protein